MKWEKKVSVKGEWAEKGKDIKNNDIVTIKSEGTIVPGKWGDQNVFKVATRNGDRNVAFNQTSLNALIDAFGEEDSGWFGKEVKITMVKQNVSGKFTDVFYFAPPDWELGENGFYPSSLKVDGEDINPADIPF